MTQSCMTLCKGNSLLPHQIVNCAEEKNKTRVTVFARAEIKKQNTVGCCSTLGGSYKWFSESIDVAEGDPDADCRSLAVQSLVLLDKSLKKQLQEHQPSWSQPQNKKPTQTMDVPCLRRMDIMFWRFPGKDAELSTSSSASVWCIRTETVFGLAAWFH